MDRPRSGLSITSMQNSLPIDSEEVTMKKWIVFLTVVFLAWLGGCATSVDLKKTQRDYDSKISGQITLSLSTIIIESKTIGSSLFISGD
jgi:hypothetical protein